MNHWKIWNGKFLGLSEMDSPNIGRYLLRIRILLYEVSFIYKGLQNSIITRLGNTKFLATKKRNWSDSDNE